MIKTVTSLLNRHFALILAGLIGAMAAGFILFILPEWHFAQLVDLFGINNFVPGAQPPYSGRAHKLAAMAAGLGTMIVAWPLIRMLEKRASAKKRKAKKPVGRGTVIVPPTPVINPFDAHPDAPPRRPIFAERELGAPLMSEEALELGDELMLGERDQALDVEPVAVDPVPATIAPPAAFEDLQWVKVGTEHQPVEPVVKQTVAVVPEPEPEHIAFAPVAHAPAETVAELPPEPEKVEDPEAINGLILRLDRALAARSVRYATEPMGATAQRGDINSLRETLKSFGGAA